MLEPSVKICFIDQVKEILRKCIIWQKGVYSLVFVFLIPWLVPIMSETGSTGEKFWGWFVMVGMTLREVAVSPITVTKNSNDWFLC